MHWTTVFDIDQSGHKDWWPLCFALILLAMTGFMAFAPREVFRKYFSRNKFDETRGGDIFRRAFGGFGLLFVLTWISLAIDASVSDYEVLRAKRDSGQFKIVEGRIEHFKHFKGDDFDVSGVHFRYSNAILTSAFNDDGGTIREGMYVRIGYVDRARYADDPYGNAIVRLEVRS